MGHAVFASLWRAKFPEIDHFLRISLPFRPPKPLDSSVSHAPHKFCNLQNVNALRVFTGGRPQPSSAADSGTEVFVKFACPPPPQRVSCP